MMKNPNWMTSHEYALVTEKTPILCVDLVVLRRTQKSLETLLLIRKTGYEKGKWCIIGGRQIKGETLEEAITRQASDLGIEVKVVPPFDFNFPAYVNDKDQDRTKHPTCCVYPVVIKGGSLKGSGEEFSATKWFPVDDLPEMAYDHRAEILKVVEQIKRFNAEL